MQTGAHQASTRANTRPPFGLETDRFGRAGDSDTKRGLSLRRSAAPPPARLAVKDAAQAWAGSLPADRRSARRGRGTCQPVCHDAEALVGMLGDEGMLQKLLSGGARGLILDEAAMNERCQVI